MAVKKLRRNLCKIFHPKHVHCLLDFIRKGPTNKIFLQSSASVSELIGGAGTALYTKTEKSKHRGFVKNALFQ
jgi:hypothetical protein